MNPHFIFNALNSIQSLIATQNYGTARQEINHFAKLMRSILHNSRQSSISLREEMDTLEQYLKIEQSCQTNPFTYSITNNCAAEMENIDIPPMLLQPFVENAVVHGIAPLQTPGHIAVHFDMDGAFLTCTVRDNGIGREKAAALKLAKQPGHQSAAMQVTKERLETMGGSVVFRDVAAGGTEVVVVVAVAF
jgi:LytS/YehU family sensor histidine kinase